MPPIIDEKKCTGCGTCAQICPLDVLKFHKQEKKSRGSLSRRMLALSSLRD